MSQHRWRLGIGAALVACVAGVAVAAAALDFGAQTQQRLADGSLELFGVEKPVAAASTANLDEAQALADPTALVTLAKGLTARVLAAGAKSNVGANMDQMVLWPPSNPTHVIGLNEQDPEDPGLQKIDLKTGVATTIVSGT